MESISFDRAADFYDQTRGLPPEVLSALAQVVADVFGRDARLLEAGIGTGRIARPLLAQGLRVTGIDLSARMMRRLIEQLPPGARRPDLAQADALALPLRDAIFDAVIVVHVFHLVSNWRAVLREIRRVLKPGGSLMNGYDWRHPDSPSSRLRDAWADIVSAFRVTTGHSHDRFDEIQTALREQGAELTEWVVGQRVETRTLRQELDAVEQRIWSSTWQLPDAVFSDCLARLKEWTIREYGSDQYVFQVRKQFVWQRFCWPVC